ncbi:MAG: hypothetical protein Q9174_001133 [Haloplaca sp. 1 TL-2023]
MPSERHFHHPFKPYAIQHELMNAVCDCIAESKVGIFESPTGTGKSLSLICSCLTWLQDERKAAFATAAHVEGEEDEPAWILEQAQRQRTERLLQYRLDLESRLSKIRDKESRQKRQYEKGEPSMKRAKLNHKPGFQDEVEGSQFLLDDYESEDEAKTVSGPRGQGDGLSITAMKLMQELGEPYGPVMEDQDMELPDELKIYFCSRTHSQLTQFVNELRRVKIPQAPWLRTARSTKTEEEEDESQQYSVVKHLPLGSRKSLCINPRVINAGNTATINERCLDLQQPSTPQDQKCPFIPNKEKQVLVNEFRDHTLAKIRDIEDLGSLGKQIGICPYYSARTSIRPSEVVDLISIVTLPYPLLLQKSAREALGISLKGHVVVIDEAHNLMDAISNIHSITVTQSQLHRCRSQLRVYLQKYRNKLKGKNRLYVTQVVRLIDSISGYLGNMTSQCNSNEALVNISDLMSGKGVDQIQLSKLIRYLAESKLARKVEGYVESIDDHGDNNPSNHADVAPALTHVQAFLQTLMNPAAEGQFFFERGESETVALRYILLDPAFHFREIVEDARAVVLAGGTMSPVSILCPDAYGDAFRQLTSE